MAQWIAYNTHNKKKLWVPVNVVDSQWVSGIANTPVMLAITSWADIVFVWSQKDGGIIDKEQLAEVPSKT